MSIGLPVYNGARYLEGAVRSLLEQTFGDFELVISDNGSTDATEDLCRSLAREDGRIRYLRQDENKGAAWNFNEVLRQARAEYFKWASHDDLHAPTFVARCIEEMEASGTDVVLCYPKTIEIDADGTRVGDFEDNLDLSSPAPSARLRRLLSEYRLSNAVFGLLRTDVVRSTGLLGNYPSSDLVLLAELALRGRFVEIPERLFLRRIHPGRSVEANKTPEEVAAWFDPSSGGRRIHPRTRLLVEHAKAVGVAPIGAAERVKSLWYLLRYYRYWPFVRGEVKRAVLRPLARR